MAMYKGDEEEVEEQSFILCTTKVVEYLQPLMSVELLCKFPDNSAYDFDYSQSTIWSPLVPRAYSPMDLDSITPRKVSYDMASELGDQKNSVRKLGSKLRKRFAVSGFNLNLGLLKNQTKGKKKNKNIVSDLSPKPLRIKSTCNPIIMKGWNKVLKAASKQFKRKKMKKDPTAHVMLPRSYRDEGF